MEENKDKLKNEIKKTENKKDKKLIILILVIVILFLLTVSLSALVGFHCFKQMNNANSQSKNINFGIDSNISSEELSNLTKEEIQNELNKKINEGMINISMNTQPTFKDGKSEGNLLIVNNTVNNYPQIVEIYIPAETETKNDETTVIKEEQLIYQSGVIPVGSRIDNAKLNVDLEKGNYDCVAYFHNVDVETQQILGTAGANIKISVLN